MTIEKMTFADDPFDDIHDHQVIDEYAAAIAAVSRGEPKAHARLAKAYAKLREKSNDRVLLA